MVTDVVAAPERDVAADPGEWLDGVVFEDEAVFLQLEAGRDRGAAAQIGHQPVALGAGGGDLFRAKQVELSVADCDKEIEILWRKFFRDALEGDHRAPA